MLIAFHLLGALISSTVYSVTYFQYNVSTHAYLTKDPDALISCFVSVHALPLYFTTELTKFCIVKFKHRTGEMN